MSIDTLERVQALQCVLWFVSECACLWVHTHTHTHSYRVCTIISIPTSLKAAQRESVINQVMLSRMGTAFSAQP